MSIRLHLSLPQTYQTLSFYPTTDKPDLGVIVASSPHQEIKFGQIISVPISLFNSC